MNLDSIKQLFPYHPNESDDFYITKFSQLYTHCNVRHFDFSHSSVSYHAIRELWRSDTIGYYIGASEPIYNEKHDKIISSIIIEINGSTAHEQYKLYGRKDNNGNFVKLFPLPYRNNFIMYDGINVITGLKEIILTIGGKKIE